MDPVWGNDGQAVLIACDGVGLRNLEAVVHVDDRLKGGQNENEKM